MQIETIRVTPVAAGDPPLLNASGLHAPFVLRTIVELETACGVTGVSEVPGGEHITGMLERCGEFVIGCDPFEINVLHARLRSQFADGCDENRGRTSWDQRSLIHVEAALEIACLDILGKALDRPVASLLGGTFRDRVPFAAYLFYKHRGAGGDLGFETDPAATGWAAARQEQALTPEEIVFQADAMLDTFGFKSIKLKAGTLEPSVEVESIRALHRHFGPAVPLRIDPNAVWSFETALACCRQLEGLVEYIEDPVSGQENMGRLAKLLGTPLATNMCTTSFADLRGSVSHESEAVILCDPHFWGGPRACIELARLCAHLPRKISMHSNNHLGISLATMVHVGAALPQFDYALDTHYPWQQDELIAGGRLAFEDGAVRVPNAPGLGVELDRDCLARLHRQYLDAGIKERDDASEMKKIDPGWTFVPERW